MNAVLHDDLVHRLLAKAKRATNARYVLGIAGIPGSGKSTLAGQLVARLNEHGCDGGAALVPMDGFHLTNARLDQLDLRQRKGAPETFDVHRYVELLSMARREPAASMYFPVYDRSLHEPVLRETDSQRIDADTRIILTEGNYLLLDIDPWRRLADVLDECWLLDTSIEQARSWIIARHVRGGRPAEHAQAHYEAVDLPNSRLILRHMRSPDLRIASSASNL
jgi:pantothenate kinase